MTIKKGVERTVVFKMVDETDFATPETGLSVTCEISKDGGAFAGTTNSAAEIGNGWYKITLTATEMSADEIILKSTATGAAQSDRLILTEDNSNKDIYDRIGAPVGADISADIATVDTNVDTLIARVPAEVAQKAHFVNGSGNITPPTDKGIWDVLGDGTKSISGLNDLAQSDILSDATPFAGANIDAAISSRSTLSQSDILSDATPFAGANIDTIKTNVDTLITRIPAEVAQKAHLVNGTGNITPPTNKGIWDVLGDGTKSISGLNDLAQSDILSDATPFAGANIDTIKTNVDTLITRIPAEVAQKAHLVNGSGDITPPTDKGIWDVLGDGTKSISGLNDLAQSDILSDATPFAGANIAAILEDTGTTLNNHLLDIKGTGFVKDTHSLPQCLTAAGFSTHSAADVWSVETRALTDKDGFSLASDQSGVTFGTVNALGTQAKADVNAEVDSALEDIDLDHLIKVDYGASKPTDGSLIDLIMNKDATQSFDPTTDSLEAIRDNQAGTDVAAIADAVWDEAIADHTTSGTFGAKNQKVVPSESVDDYKANVSSLALETTAQSIKTQTDKMQFDASDNIQARVNDKGVLNDPSSADIADAVWDEAIADHTTGTTFGGKNQKIVPSETIDDYKADVATALTNIHLDHLLATDYDPSNKPGAATALLNVMVENDGGVPRYTANALENAPIGSGGLTAAVIADAVWDEDLSTHTNAGTAGKIVNSIKKLIDTILAFVS